jgi:NADP-dependent 3-hydroxy acid dehydrogenase YdfG
MSTLRGRWALVTGATSGFGEAIARALAREGASVVITGRRADRLAGVADEIRTRDKVEVVPLEFDVRERDSVDRALGAADDLLRKLDLVVNNAGLALALESVAAGDPDDWDQMIDTNVKGLLYVTRAVLPGMLERGRGHVVNIGSVAGIRSMPEPPCIPPRSSPCGPSRTRSATTSSGPGSGSPTWNRDSRKPSSAS